MPDPLYVKAREVLLDALEALGPHRHAVVVVGAQALYLHTGEGDIAVAPFTTDADIAIDPQGLGERPILGEALQAAGFVGAGQPGQWIKDAVRVDLMVPDTVAGPGRRGVRLGPHGTRAARKARGLEGALVDRESHPLPSLANTARTLDVLVAGPAALLVSKLHKLGERLEDPGRLKDKDALDVLRLLRGIQTAALAARLQQLRGDPRSAAVTEEGLQHLEHLFSRPDDRGSMLAVRATEGLESAATIAASCAALTEDLLSILRSSPT